jgi:hypothetical protein
MEGLTRSGEGGQYIKQALSYMDNSWDLIHERLVARRGLIRIVRAFLYSDLIATRMRTDSQAGGGASQRQGYPMKAFDFGPWPIENPLRFVDGYTTGANPAVSLSMWMLNMLAFNVRHGDE